MALSTLPHVLPSLGQGSAIVTMIPSDPSSPTVLDLLGYTPREPYMDGGAKHRVGGVVISRRALRPAAQPWRSSWLHERRQRGLCDRTRVLANSIVVCLKESELPDNSVHC